MNMEPPVIAADRKCLAAWRRERRADHLRPVVARYAALVHASALRRTGDATLAAAVTRAVFLVFARRARRLPRKVVLAGWLFRITALAARKVQPPRRAPIPPLPAEAPLWARVTTTLDAALDRLPDAKLNAVLLQAFLQHSAEAAAVVLRSRASRVQRRSAAGWRAVVRRLRAPAGEADALWAACAAEGTAPAVPEELLATIGAELEQTGARRPMLALARRTLNTLAWRRWSRRVLVGGPVGLLLLGTLLGTLWYIDSLSGHSRSMSMLLEWSVRNEARKNPGLAQPARAWQAPTEAGPATAAALRSEDDFYRATNIWPAHLRFSRAEWEALQPKRVAPLPNFMQPDGTVLLRNPKAQRSGVAGVLGFDFDWSQGAFELGGRACTNVAVRVKGNGTYLGSLFGQKRSFKVDLNKRAPGQKLAGLDEFNFHNLVADQSSLSDALGYEFFRECGVPASRTAYAWLEMSVAGRMTNQALGLYALVEPVNDAFAARWFGSKKAPLFKPVTYQLFEHLGDDWAAYEAIYDLKTDATPAQQQRVIEFARLVSRATDEEFARRAGEFLDLDEFARFLAGVVLLSNYDSFLANGQNFYVYLDPRSNKFGFIPWDLDLAWGSFFLLATREEREQASIWHPWVGRHRLLERVMSVESFRGLYRAHLEDFLQRLFVPERLHRRVDEVAAIIRPAVAAESAFRLDKFDQAVGRKPVRPGPESAMGADRTAHDVKAFITRRAASVRAQLDGKSDGVILERGPRKRR